jgi:hypothetical protein
MILPVNIFQSTEVYLVSYTTSCKFAVQITLEIMPSSHHYRYFFVEVSPDL